MMDFQNMTWKNGFRVSGGRSVPLFVEIVPPELDQEEARISQHIAYLNRYENETGLDAVNIPEIQDEEQKGEKGERLSEFRERIAPREYARMLSRQIQSAYVINRVIVKETPETQEQWLLETYHNFGITSVVLVGGEFPDYPYEGPSVTEGNQLVKKFLNKGKRRFAEESPPAPTNLSVGNISIPDRCEDDFEESERMMLKIKSGADFFTTQIIAESDNPVILLKDLAEKRATSGVPLPAIFWSFSPITSQKDINFLRWLGVRIPEAFEKMVMNSSDPAAASMALLEKVWLDILNANASLSDPFSMGINIAAMGKRHYDYSIELVKRLDNVTAEWTRRESEMFSR